MAAFVLMRARQRRALRRSRVFRDHLNPLERFDDVELFSKFRFRRNDIISLTDELRADIEHANRLGSIPSLLQVCLALRFYASDTYQDICGELLNVSKPTASRTIKTVTQAMLCLIPLYIRFPTKAEAEAQKTKFYAVANFPGVFGCVDGTHIPIQRPVDNEHEYVNRKNVHWINVQVLCEADMMFTDVVAKWPGSAHDATVLRESSFFNVMEQPNPPVQGYVLGDSGYMLRKWLLTPLINPSTRSEERYNFSQSSTRCTVERAIGVCKNRWNCLRKLRLTPNKACDVIIVYFTLSNRARLLNLPEPDRNEDGENDDDDDDDDDDEDDDEDDRNLSSERARVTAGKTERQRVINMHF